MDNAPILLENYADNGAFSHWSLIDSDTGELLWSEAPEEEIQQVKNLHIPDVRHSLPSDEKIDDKACDYIYEKTYVSTENNHDSCREWAFADGAKWMRDLITGNDA
ncbi:MAG: hypothetical protein ACK5MK_13930 [Dysgonomonas sp.]